MASSNQTPDVLFSPIAANADASDINTIPQTYDPANYGYAAQNVGFPTECRLPVLNPDGTLGQGRAPRMQDWNGIMKLVSSHNFFLQNGGSYTFNPTVSSNIGGYPKNAVLWYFPENEAPCLVYSLINDNTNNFVDDPTLIDGSHWEMLVNPSNYANTDLSNLSATGNDKFVTKNTNQTISGVKTFSSGTLRTNTPLLLKQNNTTEGGQIDFERGGSSVLSSNPYIDLNTNTIRVIGTSSQNATHITLKVDLENNQVLVPTPAATDGSYQAATTAWCQAYIGVVDYSAGTDVTASVFATSGTGYKPAYKGVLMIKTYNSTAIAYLSVYNASGTLLFKKEINTAPYPNTSGGLVVLPVSQSYSYRVEPLAAGDSYALFCPYRSH